MIKEDDGQKQTKVKATCSPVSHGVLGMLSFETSSFPPGFFRVEGGRKFHPACRGEPGDTVYPKEISNITAFITRPTDVGICQLAWTI